MFPNYLYLNNQKNNNIMSLNFVIQADSSVRIGHQAKQIFNHLLSNDHLKKLEHFKVKGIFIEGAVEIGSTYLSTEKDSWVVVFDNTTGDLWQEEFKKLDEAINWLKQAK